jgi:hypothetical protein
MLPRHICGVGVWAGKLSEETKIWGTFAKSQPMSKLLEHPEEHQSSVIDLASKNQKKQNSTDSKTGSELRSFYNLLFVSHSLHKNLRRTS